MSAYFNIIRDTSGYRHSYANEGERRRETATALQCCKPAIFNFGPSSSFFPPSYVTTCIYNARASKLFYLLGHLPDCCLAAALCRRPNAEPFAHFILVPPVFVKCEGKGERWDSSLH